jgi:hypothetical protein
MELKLNNIPNKEPMLVTKAGHVERYQLQSYRFKPFL